MKLLGWNYQSYSVSSYTVHSFIVPYSWSSCECRVREQMQRKDSFILRALWETGMWRLARLMYLTQWKPRAEPMKTTFQGGQELAWFMASLLDGVQYLDRSRGNSSFNSPSLYGEQWSPAPDTPHSSLLSHCFIYSWLTRSRGSAPPFWGVEISSTGLYKWWQWLYRWTGGSWHRKVIKRINGLLIHTVRQICWYCLTYLACFLTAKWKLAKWVKCPATGYVPPTLWCHISQSEYECIVLLQLAQSTGSNIIFYFIIKPAEWFLFVCHSKYCMCLSGWKSDIGQHWITHWVLTKNLWIALCPRSIILK